MRSILAITVIAAGLAACSTPRPVNYGFIDYVGDSRRALEAEYGPPGREEVSADGETVLIYAFAFPGNADPQVVLSDGMAAAPESGEPETGARVPMQGVRIAAPASFPVVGGRGTLRLEVTRDGADMRFAYTKALYDTYVAPDLGAWDATPVPA